MGDRDKRPLLSQTRSGFAHLLDLSQADHVHGLPTDPSDRLPPVRLALVGKPGLFVRVLTGDADHLGSYQVDPDAPTGMCSNIAAIVDLLRPVNLACL